MGKLIFVTGGARSGKSSFAEDTAKQNGEKVVYIATAIAFDEEMKQRIQLHRQQRPESWHTIETYQNIAEALRDYNEAFDCVLLDCVTIMVNNIMMDEITDWEQITEAEGMKVEMIAKREITSLIEYCKESDKTFIIVTNETGSGIVPYYPSSRLFRDVAGRVNQMLARASDEAYLLVSSLPVRLK
ncbi:MAG: bifunctional adenosylcobinamide kinase/adenosylcobinamide-phosphate guanylyltransferase [Clostridia bacterium]|nr:bifunctional adenosylcobinamide kinase/adenosylcobinamide-phosphate guanylyltransferase [Clostridia bacterium]